MSIKIESKDQIFILYILCKPSDFSLAKLGKITLIITLEGPVTFILLILTNIIALNSYKKFNLRKELVDRTNNIEMMSKGEIKKKIENKDRKLMMMN